LVLPSAGEVPFAQLVVAEPPDTSPVGSAMICIETGGLVVRVPIDISAARLGDIVRALRLS